MRKKLMVLLAAMTFCFAASATAAERQKEVEYGISGGLLLPGSIVVNGYDVDTKLAPMFRFILDAYVADRFMMGAYVNFAIVGIDGLYEYDYYGNRKKADESANMFEFGGAFKGRFLLSPTVAFKPGLNVGYRIITSDMFDKKTNGFAVNFSAEFQFIGDNFSPYIDAGFLAQPVGGNADVDLTFPPVFYLTGGISL